MKKWYGVYLVVMVILCLVGLWRLMDVTNDAATKLAAIRAEAQTVEASAQELEQVVAVRQKAQEVAEAHLEATKQAIRIKAALDAEAARINREIAARPKPAPVTGWAPGNKVSGRVYSNASIRPAQKPPVAPPDVQGARLVIELDPRYGTAELERLTRDKRLSCAAFSYQPEPGVTRNRVYCAQKGS